MKNYAKVLVFAAIAALIVVPAHAISPEMCKLIESMQGVFKLLRVLAFVGAGFYMAGWAWKYISSGDAKMDDVKKQGIGLLVGFTLLFAIGIVLSFLISYANGGGLGNDCPALTTGWNTAVPNSIGGR